MRTLSGITAVVFAAHLMGLAVACGDGSTTVEGSDARPGADTWRRLPDAPLSPRAHAVVVGVGDRMLVVGGWKFLCPPMADCSGPDDPLLDDGAVYDARDDTWQAISPPPFGVRRGEYSSAALDGSAYLLTGCAQGPTCAGPLRLLEYDVGRDRWTDHGRVPAPGRYRHLVALEDRLLAHSGSDEYGEVADLVFDPATSTWTELPDDPLPSSYDRFAVPVVGQIVLVGSPRDEAEETTKAAARLDLTTQEWIRLPDAPGQGYQLMPTERGPLLNGHFIDAPGWLLDPETWTWASLPEQTGDQNDLRGVLDRDGASYDIPNSVGEMASSMRLHLYDSAADGYVGIPAPPGLAGVYDDSSTALGRDLFVFGGQRWPEADGGSGVGDGELVADAWLWTAPPPR